MSSTSLRKADYEPFGYAVSGMKEDEGLLFRGRTAEYLIKRLLEVHVLSESFPLSLQYNSD